MLRRIDPNDPFRLGERALIAVLRLANHLSLEVATALKPHGLTLHQYNVLRILRGAGSNGLTCSQIGERMLSRDPDITRLLDRLERAELISRARDTADRRVVTSTITQSGLDLLAELDEPILELDRELFAALDDVRLQQLTQLAAEARGE